MLDRDQDQPVRLRICNGEGERILAASIELVEQVLSPAADIRMGTEISLTQGERMVVALALGGADSYPHCEASEFLLSSINTEHAALTGPVSRGEALRQFREFILASAAGNTKLGSRVSL